MKYKSREPDWQTEFVLENQQHYLNNNKRFPFGMKPANTTTGAHKFYLQNKCRNLQTLGDEQFHDSSLKEILNVNLNKTQGSCSSPKDKSLLEAHLKKHSPRSHYNFALRKNFIEDIKAELTKEIC